MTDSNATELKSCPFCGGEAVIKKTHRWPHWAGNEGCDGFTVICTNFDCTIYEADVFYATTEEEAIEAWNTRHEQTCEMEYHTEGMKRGWWVCSKCDKAMDTIESCGGRKPPKFCGNCGAKVKQSVSCRKADEETAARGDAEILEDPVKTWQKQILSLAN